MKRGLTRPQIMLSTGRLPLTLRAVCATAPCLPVAAVGGEDPWVSIVRTFVDDFARRGITRRSFEVWEVNGSITAESQEYHSMYNATHAPGTSAGASLISDRFLATVLWSLAQYTLDR